MSKLLPCWPRLVLTLCLGTAFAFLWMFATAWLASFFEPRATSYQSMIVDATGRPLVQTSYSYDPYQTQHEYHDLAGNVVARKTNDHHLPTSHYAAKAYAHYESISPWACRVTSFVEGKQESKTPPTYWYLILDKSESTNMYFVGYHSVTCQCQGYIGKSGYSETVLTQQDRFPLPSQANTLHRYALGDHSLRYSPYHTLYPRLENRPASDLQAWQAYLWDGQKQVFFVDLRERTVKLIFDGEGILGLGTIHKVDDRGQAVRRLTVFARDEVLLFDENHQPSQRSKLPAELIGKDFTWGQLPNGGSLFYTSEDLGYTLKDFRKRGEVRYRLHYVTQSGEQTTPTIEHTLRRQRSEPAMQSLLGLFCPAPLPLTVAAPVLSATTLGTDFSTSLRLGYAEFWPALLIGIAVGAVLAWRTHLREVFYATDPKTRWVWVLLVFLFGLFGWLGYRFSRAWPKLEPCGSCGQPAPLDRPTCAHCQVSSPLPSLQGTEIFA